MRTKGQASPGGGDRGDRKFKGSCSDSRVVAISSAKGCADGWHRQNGTTEVREGCDEVLPDCPGQLFIHHSP